MEHHRQRLRRLALHDDALLGPSAAEDCPFTDSPIDQRTTTLVRIAATIAVEAAPVTFQREVSHALVAGVSADEMSRRWRR